MRWCDNCHGYSSKNRAWSLCGTDVYTVYGVIYSHLLPNVRDTFEGGIQPFRNSQEYRNAINTPVGAQLLLTVLPSSEPEHMSTVSKALVGHSTGFLTTGNTVFHQAGYVPKVTIRDPIRNLGHLYKFHIAFFILEKYLS